MFFIQHPSFGQDSIKSIEKKFQVHCTLSFGFKGYFGERYIEPTPHSWGDQPQKHQFDRFTKKPTYSFGSGLFFSFKIAKHW